MCDLNDYEEGFWKWRVRGQRCDKGRLDEKVQPYICVTISVWFLFMLCWQQAPALLSELSGLLAEYLLCMSLPFSIQFTSLSSDEFSLTCKIWNLSYDIAKLLLVHVNCLSFLCHIQSSTPINKGHSWKGICLLIGSPHSLPPPHFFFKFCFHWRCSGVETKIQH